MIVSIPETQKLEPHSKIILKKQIDDGLIRLFDECESTDNDHDDSEDYIPEGFPRVDEIDRSDASEENVERAMKALMCTGIRKYRVLYSKGSVTKKSPWFLSRRMSNLAKNILKGKGYQVMCFVD